LDLEGLGCGLSLAGIIEMGRRSCGGRQLVGVGKMRRLIAGVAMNAAIRSRSNSGVMSSMVAPGSCSRRRRGSSRRWAAEGAGVGPGPSVR